MVRARRIDDPHALFCALLREDFGTFLRKAYPAIRGGEGLRWNWHLDAIVHRLDAIRTGASRRLLVTMPPRNLKSIAISVAWVAWMLGRNPRSNFVCVSYSNELSAKLARDCLAIIQTGWYRELFPGTVISPKRTASGDFETTLGGGRLATSITGTLTGRGGDIIIIDDPIKPDDAHSETIREGVNHWFQSTLASRLNDKATGAIITVMQRLHQYDLAGTILEAGGWDMLSLPAVATADETILLPRGRIHIRKIGDVLHPEREPLAVLEAQRHFMGSYDYAAQYQQDPVPATGNVIQAGWLKTYSLDFDPRSSGQIVLSFDTANKDGTANDWSVCIIAHVHRRQVRILDVFRRKVAFPELRRRAYQLARDYRATTILIEDQASGTQLIQAFRDEQPPGLPQPIACRAETDKGSRMAGVSAQIEAGELMLPIDAAWLAEFKSELLGFPNARHDDQADALSQLMSWVARNAANIAPPLEGPEFYYRDEWGTLRSSDGERALPIEDEEIDPWSGL